MCRYTHTHTHTHTHIHDIRLDCIYTQACQLVSRTWLVKTCTSPSETSTQVVSGSGVVGRQPGVCLPPPPPNSPTTHTHTHTHSLSLTRARTQFISLPPSHSSLPTSRPAWYSLHLPSLCASLFLSLARALFVQY
jgi:hypothetical protein